MGRMRPGGMDRRITVRQRVLGQDAAGTDIPTFPDLFTVWASFTPISQSERFTSQQRLAVETGTFRFRWRSDWVPSPAEHELFDARTGKTWDVTGVAEIGRAEGWDITAEARRV